jgi:prevent-host-death family protein
MRRQISVAEFKARCLRLLYEVQRSRKEILITKRGRPVARLLPADTEAPVLLGRMRGSIEIHGDLIAPIGEIWDAGK